MTLTAGCRQAEVTWAIRLKLVIISFSLVQYRHCQSIYHKTRGTVTSWNLFFWGGGRNINIFNASSPWLHTELDLSFCLDKL